MGYEIGLEYATASEISEFMGLDHDDERELGADSGASETNPDRLYVGSANIPLFRAGMPVRVWDTANPIGEDMEVESIGTDYVVLTEDLTGDYLITNYAKFQILSHFTMRSKPTVSVIEKWIKEAQEDIDKRMRNTFLADGRRFEKWFDFEPRWRLRYPLSAHGYPFFPHDVYWVITIDREPLMPLDLEKGDHIYIYSGSDIEDLLDGTHTEWQTENGGARTAADFWCDYEHGQIFLFKTRPRYGLKAAKVIARQGSRRESFDADSEYYESQTKVPADIHTAAMMWVGIRLLEQERYAFNTPSGNETGLIDLRVQISGWKKEIEHKLGLNREMPFLNKGR